MKKFSLCKVVGIELHSLNRMLPLHIAQPFTSLTLALSPDRRVNYYETFNYIWMKRKGYLMPILKFSSKNCLYSAPISLPLLVWSMYD